MKDALVDFLQEMSKSPELQAKYKADPKETAKAHGLSDEDCDCLLKGDEAEINKRFEAKGFASQAQVINDFD